MCDVFKIDWIKRMKSDDVVNGVAHTDQSDINVNTVLSYVYNILGDVPTSYGMDEHFSTWDEAYSKWDIEYHQNTTEALRRADDLENGNVRSRIGDPYVKFDFFAYKTPPSIYNLHQPSLR